MRQPETLCAAFQHTAAAYPDRTALRTVGGAVAMTWRQYAAQVRRIAAGLAGLGVRRHDTIALMMTNRPEFHLVDAAAMHLGTVPFSLYNTSSPQQLTYQLTDAGSRVVICEPLFLPSIQATGLHLDHIICVEQPVHGTQYLPALQPAADFDFDVQWQATAPDDVVTLIYTSGTTGPPKGVQLTHRCVLAEVQALADAGFDVRADDRIISYLPAAHAVDRCASHYFPMLGGAQVTSVPDPTAIVEALTDVRPTVWAAAPRFWEKTRTRVETTITTTLDENQRRAVSHALRISTQKVRLEQAGEPIPVELLTEHAQTEEHVLSFLRNTLGFDRLRYAFSGMAAIPRETLEFFLALGIPIVEGWGMSEATAVATANPLNRPKVGTVGIPLPGVEARLADDGELLIRGALLMKGYRNNPTKTAETIDPAGWLHTGDLAFVDSDGYITITGRKKELIINAAGKKMSPTNIENAIKTSCSLVDAVIAIGDRRPYNVALITLDLEAANALYPDATIAELVHNPHIRNLIETGIAAANATLSRVEQIKKYKILPTSWGVAGGELTPTLKFRRHVIAEKYANEINRLYQTSSTVTV